MSSEVLVSVTGVVLSLLFSYVPGLAGWYNQLDGQRKRLVMLFMLAVVALGMYALTCVGLGEQYGISLTCDQAGAATLLEMFVLAMIGNQAAYLISPKVQ